MKKMERQSIKWKMVGILLICWMIPIGLMIGVMGYYILGNHMDNMVNSFQKQLAYSTKMSKERLNGAIFASREASVDNEIRKEYLSYKSGKNTSNQFYKKTEKYLTKKYKQNDSFYCTIFWCRNNPDFDNRDVYNLRSGVYNLSTGGSYQHLTTYWDEDHETIVAFAENLDTTVGFLNLDGRLYMIRNIMDSNFDPFGLLVMRLNIPYCFGSLSNIPMQEAVTLTLNDQIIPVNGELLDTDDIGINFAQSREGYQKDQDGFFIYNEGKESDYYISAVMKMDTKTVDMPFYGYGFIIGGMLLLLLPLLWMVLRVFHRQVTRPVADMIEGSAQIEKGNMGYQLEVLPENMEFQYLFNSFNHMSQTLKNQFERIYKEEIALRDARIMALQSHINPHFMNNTLEIINWEARLSGDIKVTKMIEALSTLQDAAIDRKKRPVVPLSEEMIYVNAYLYITKERLGKRLQVTINLPEEIMGYYLPRLILQPVIENAIEHGIVPTGSGEVLIEGYTEEKFLILEIINDGKLTAKNREQIRLLLRPDYNTSQESFSSMGIANVNQRLRILYGEECGLSITQGEGEKIVARLVISTEEKEQTL